MRTPPALHAMITPLRWPLDSMKPTAARSASAGVLRAGRMPAWLLGVVMIWPAFFYRGCGAPWPTDWACQVGGGGGGRSGALMAVLRPAAVLRLRGPGGWPGVG